MPRKKLKAGEKAYGGILFVAQALGYRIGLLQEAKQKAAHSELEEKPECAARVD